MALIELSSTLVSNFSLTLYKGVAVVRNYKRIIGLMGPWYKEIPAQFHSILADPNFIGNVGNETIVWSTDVFQSEPTRLSNLSGAEQERYRGILRQAMQAYATALVKAEDETREMLFAAITYPSEHSVFCGDDRVVITDWGMKSARGGHLTELSFFITDPLRDTGKPLPEPETVASVASEEPEAADEPVSSQDTEPTPIPEPVVPPRPAPVPNPEPEPKPEPQPGPQDTKKQAWWNKWWIWLILGLLLIGIILFFILRVGYEDRENGELIQKMAPVELSEDDFVLQDSLTYVAKGRIILLVKNRDYTLEDFARAFYDEYPDRDKYTFSNPDTVFNRVTLTLPEDERQELTDRLPGQFRKFNIVALPDKMISTDKTPSDPGMKDAKKRWYFDECSVFDAWDITEGSPNVIVAVIDDGFDLNHPELKGKVVMPYNAVTQNSNVTPSQSGHGTHVAATAVGNANNGTGVAGIAPGCKLMPIQIANSKGVMSSSAIMDGLAYAISNGANVINMSLGTYFGPWMQFAPLYVQENIQNYMFLDEQEIWDYLFDVAVDNNISVVLAGGNENILIGMDPMKRNSRTIRVSAVQPDRVKADFSNFGNMSTVSAPGVQIYNAIPGARYDFMDGTSMASPIVAGGCALLLSKDPTLSPAEVATILVQTGNPSPSDVGPVVNFARALTDEIDFSSDDCFEINRRYLQLLDEIEKIKREHPGCIQTPDTLSLPENFSAETLTGKWKSTSYLTNDQDEEVTIYFTFNGSNTGLLEIVEPTGRTASSPITVNVSNDVLYIDQVREASGTTSRYYNPYTFTVKPDRNRKASGHGKNKVDAMNQFDFTLVRI